MTTKKKATVQIIARDAAFRTVRRYRTRTYATVANALCADLPVDAALVGADNVLVIVRDADGFVRLREMIR